MKNQNQSTFPTYHSNSNGNSNNNTDNNNYFNTYKFNNNTQLARFQQHQQQQQQQDQLTQNQRQHSNRSRCQFVPPQQFLLPTTNQQRNKINPTTYQQQQKYLPTPTSTTTTTATATEATMSSSLTTSQFVQNQFNNFANPQQHLTPYQQYAQIYQQQYSTLNRNGLQQQQMLQQQQKQQQQQNQEQQQSDLQFQRRQQLQLPLLAQSNNSMLQQFQQQNQRRQLFEQPQQNAAGNNNNYNNNNINNNNNNNNGGINCKSSASMNGVDNDKFSMDANEIANFLANELFAQQIVSLDGIQSGVPTLTTSTLTPTLMKSIQESFTELVESEPVITGAAPFQAGFIPPTYPSTSNNTASGITNAFSESLNDFNETESEDSQNSLGLPMYEDNLEGETTENSSATTDSTSFQNGLHKSLLATSNSNSASTTDFSTYNATLGLAGIGGGGGAGKKSNNANTSTSATTSTTSGTTTTRRNQGGRRPAKPSNLSPEEEDKRRIRRERNKLAAARCRQRRVDQTNQLMDEVSQLEKKRDGLQKDIATLNTQKQELEYILEAHRPTCQKVVNNNCSGLIAAAAAAVSCGNDNSGTIIGNDATLAAAAAGRNSPMDLKPEILGHNLLGGLQHIKHEPIDSVLDGSSLDNDDGGPSSPKRMLLTSNNPMVAPALPKIGTLSPSLAAASLNTPIVTTAPFSFANFNNVHQQHNNIVNTLNAINKPLLSVATGTKQRPTTLPTMPRNPTLSLNDGKPAEDINGVAIQTPSTGVFNFNSLMEGGTGLTPVSGPLIPNCSSQNKHPLELATPTSEPSKLVSL